MKMLDDKGMALVMVLSVVLVMVTVAIQLHQNERDNMLNAAAMTDRMTLDQMTVSAVHLAMAVLVKDRLDSDIDSVQEDWADEETLKTLLEQIPFDQGTVGLKIIDELSKIQINALVEQPRNQYDDDVTQDVSYKTAQRGLWERLADNLLIAIELLGDEVEEIEETDKETILDSLKDWLDKDDNVTVFKGAESEYYEDLEPPYECKNGPFDHISEVRLVKGITPEVFNGIGELGGIGDYITVYGAEKPGPPGAPGASEASETPEQPGARETSTQGQPPGAQPGIVYDYPGKININTAELPVLSVMMKNENEGLANMLVEYRVAMEDTQYRNNLSVKKNWYEGILAGSSDLDTTLIRTSSNIFRIIATAELNGAKATTTVVIQREQETTSSPWQCKVLNWETD